MIQRVTVLGLALLFAATVASAQSTIRVRSGEHPTYSRLVIPVPADVQWAMTLVNREVRLDLPGVDTKIDASAVFDRIPKTRVLSVSSAIDESGASLMIALGCSCTAQATISGPYVVIDVLDPELERDLQTASKNQNEATAPEPSSADGSTSRPQARDVEAPTQNGRETKEQPRASRNPGFGISDEPLEVAPDSSTPPASSVAGHLFKQLQRAADQGLVDLVEDTATAVPPSAEVDPEIADVPAAPSIDETIDGMDELAKRLQRALGDLEAPSINDAIRLRIPEELEISPQAPLRLPETLAIQDPNKRPEHCLDDEQFDLSVLNERQDVAPQINALRASLIGEFDQPDVVSAEKLARTYIALGLGPEASVIVEQFVSQSPNYQILIEMIATIDGDGPVRGGILDKSAECGGPAALWRLAMFKSKEPWPVPDPEEIVKELSEIQIPLRRQIGPKIVEGLLSRDQLDAARSAFSVVDRAPGYHGSSHELQRAALLRLGRTTRTCRGYLSADYCVGPTFRAERDDRAHREPFGTWRNGSQ